MPLINEAAARDKEIAKSKVCATYLFIHLFLMTKGNELSSIQLPMEYVTDSFLMSAFVSDSFDPNNM